LDRFRAQIKEFREDDETRWKYAEKEWQRQWRILKEAGGSDEQFKETLKKAGINVGALEAEYKNELKRPKSVIEELRSIEAPPPKRGRKERILLDQNTVMVPLEINTLIYPPAQDAWGNTEDCGFNLGLGEINVKGEATGDGWGWAATASPPPARRLHAAVLLLPPAGRRIDGGVSCGFPGRGRPLRARSLVHVDRAYRVDDRRVMSRSLSVSARDPVWIKLTVTHQCSAHSSSAHVAYDFRTGSDRRIRVEYIRIHMPGARLVALP
jgi:hypothetical protein